MKGDRFFPRAEARAVDSAGTIDGENVVGFARLQVVAQPCGAGDEIEFAEFGVQGLIGPQFLFLEGGVGLTAEGGGTKFP
jgi:hypothetical protein